MKYVLLGLSVIVAMPLMASNSDMDSEEIFMGRGSFVSSYDSRSYVDRHTAMTPSEEKERFERIFFEEVSSEKRQLTCRRNPTILHHMCPQWSLMMK